MCASPTLIAALACALICIGQRLYLRWSSHLSASGDALMSDNIRFHLFESLVHFIVLYIHHSIFRASLSIPSCLETVFFQ